MSRIAPVAVDATSPETQATLAAVKAKIGAVPNLFKVLAHSPAALNAYLAESEALSAGVLPATLREQLALTVAGVNGCDYCASAHTLIGKGTGLAPAELALNLTGKATDAKAAAALAFARTVVARRGHVGDDDLARLRAAGYADAAIVEIVAHVGLNILTNYLNNVAQTAIDFPPVSTAGIAG